MGAEQPDTVSRQAWLAAYAVGLAVRVRGVPEAAADAVAALSCAAEGDASMLARARRRVADLASLDPSLRDGASDLLDTAAAAASPPASRAC